MVEEVTDPNREWTLAEAKRQDRPNAQVGTEIVMTRPTDVLGRIAAQTAKQVIMQKVREAERDTVYNEYVGRAGEAGELHREAHGRSGHHCRTWAAPKRGCRSGSNRASKRTRSASFACGVERGRRAAKGHR